MSSSRSHPVYPQCSPGITEATITLPRLWTQRELCAYLNKSEAWAERARLTGDGPPYMKVGRSVRYQADEVLAWLEAKRRRSTSDHGPSTAEGG